MNYNTIIKIDFEECLILYGKVPDRMFINKPKYKFIEYYPNPHKKFLCAYAWRKVRWNKSIELLMRMLGCQ